VRLLGNEEKAQWLSIAREVLGVTVNFSDGTPSLDEIESCAAEAAAYADALIGELRKRSTPTSGPAT
jgi:hypothetical protein